MKRRVRPSNSPVPCTGWWVCDVFDDEELECCKTCWCQAGMNAYQLTACACPCHQDKNTRGVYK